MDGLDALVYTVPEAAKALRVSADQIRLMVRQGTIATVPGVGRRTLISRAWLAHWVEQASTTSPSGPTGAVPPAGRGEPLERRGDAAGPDTPLPGGDHNQGPIPSPPGTRGASASPRQEAHQKNATGPGLAHRGQVA